MKFLLVLAALSLTTGCEQEDTDHTGPLVSDAFELQAPRCHKQAFQCEHGSEPMRTYRDIGTGEIFQLAHDRQINPLHGQLLHERCVYGNDPEAESVGYSFTYAEFHTGPPKLVQVDYAEVGEHFRWICGVNENLFAVLVERIAPAHEWLCFEAADGRRVPCNQH